MQYKDFLVKTRGLNTERDWQELQETNSGFIVLDSNDLMVSCNDKYSAANSSHALPLDCFWLDSEQRIFQFCEFKGIVGKEIKLLFTPSDSETYRVKVLVEAFQLFDREYYSLLIQNDQTAINQDSTLSSYQMAQALSADLKKNRLKLNYQPQVNIVDNSLYGVEVLARWSNSTFGSVTPDHFIALAEDFGLIAELDLWVLRQSCQQLALWRDRGIHIPIIAVNFSPLSLQSHSIKNEIQSILNDNNILASSLVIEVTESKKIKPFDSFIDVISELHLMGVNISLDDFGTEYSNLKRLLKFPVSQLKLDRAFVSELPARFSKELSEIVLSISEKLGAVTIAEGVETQQQLSCLTAMGYQIVQGYFYTPPLSALEFESWLSSIRMSKKNK